MAVQERSTEAFVGQVLTDLAACYGGVMVSTGHRLGLYRALAGQGPLSSFELAARTGCEERYVREWLNSQVVGGYLAYHEESETYELPAEHVPVLVDEDSPLFLPPAFDIPASMWFDQERTLEVFRSGEGIPWGEHDGRLYCGISVIYRNAYRASLVQDWLPALDGVVEKLERGIRVADVGCGYGHSTVLMASAFERSRFVGFDTHEASLEAARAEAEAAGVADQVEFQRRRRGHVRGRAVRPDLLLRHAPRPRRPGRSGAPRARLAGRGRHADGRRAVRRGQRRRQPRAVGRLYYTGSTTLCCPHSRSEAVGLALGAQAGPARLSAVLREAGFTRVRTVQETAFNIVLEARP